MGSGTQPEGFPEIRGALMFFVCSCSVVAIAPSMFESPMTEKMKPKVRASLHKELVFPKRWVHHTLSVSRRAHVPIIYAYL
jgi:hypothetical protein